MTTAESDGSSAAPSPHPATHMSFPAGDEGGKSKVDNGTGYVAPTFEKKEDQMEAGKSRRVETMREKRELDDKRVQGRKGGGNAAISCQMSGLRNHV